MFYDIYVTGVVNDGLLISLLNGRENNVSENKSRRPWVIRFDSRLIGKIGINVIICFSTFLCPTKEGDVYSSYIPWLVFRSAGGGVRRLKRLIIKEP